MFSIEKGIPTPKLHQTGATRFYPFSDMEIGDSFFVPCSSRTEVDRIQSSIMGSIRNSRKKIPERFTTRQVKDEFGIVFGVRCWRVE